MSLRENHPWMVAEKPDLLTRLTTVSERLMTSGAFMKRRPAVAPSSLPARESKAVNITAQPAELPEPKPTLRPSITRHSDNEFFEAIREKQQQVTAELYQSSIRSDALLVSALTHSVKELGF